MRADLRAQKELEKQQKIELRPTAVDMFNKTILASSNWGSSNGLP